MLVEIVSSVISLVFFLIGIRVGQSMKSDKPILPKPTNPMDLYKQRESKKIEEERQREVAIMLDNVDNYDGTPNKQKEIK